MPKKPRDSTSDEIFSFSSPLSRIPHNLATSHPLIAAKNKAVEKPVLKPQLNNPTISRSSTQSSLHKKEKVSKDEKLKSSKSSFSVFSTKSEIKHGKTSISSGEKDRRSSETLIENEMKKVREKAARKFPTDEKEREKYIRKKHEKLKQRVEELLRQTESKKEVVAKKSVSILLSKTLK